MKASRVLALVAASAGALAVAGSASAADYLYYSFSTSSAGGVGRVGQDGSGDTVLVTLPTGSDSAGIAVAGSNIYFGVDDGTSVTSIERTDLSGANRSTFVSNPCQSAPGGAYYGIYSLTTNGKYLYYVCRDNGAGEYLARVNLATGAKDEAYLALGSYPGYVYAAVSGTYAYLGTSMAVSRIELRPGAAVETVTGPNTLQGIAVNESHVFYGANSQTIARAPLNLSNPTTAFISGVGQKKGLAITPSYIFAAAGGSGETIKRANIDGSGTVTSIINLGTTRQASAHSLAVPVATDEQAPPNTPTAGPAAATSTTAAKTASPSADLIRPVTTTNTREASRSGAVQVTVPLLLRQTGRYTFIFEGPSTQKSVMSLEMQNGKRVVQQKGSRLGKRKLTKPYTAPAVTMGTENARLVVNALIKKAQAKNLRLRVIHKATNGSLSEQVFNA